MATAGEHLARWQGGVDERLDGLEEATARIERDCRGSTARIEKGVGELAGRVGVLEVASGKFGVKAGMLVAVLGTVGGIVGTGLATLLVYLLLGVNNP